MLVHSDSQRHERVQETDGLPPRPHPRSAPAGKKATLLRPARYLLAKRVFDIVLAALLLALTAPLILLASILVKLTSRGPVFYSQVRLGLNGRPFTIYKIRTMIHNCEKVSGARWARPGDSRITGVGRFLRKSHIDELPQLWNVLSGAMSLIGPRPERPEFVPQLEQVIPFYRDRMLVRPGLTGLAQVQLPPDTDLASVRLKLACDLFYIQHVGFWLDLRITFATAFYLLKIPFAASRCLFRVPSGDPVELAYQKLVASSETVPEIQTV